MRARSRALEPLTVSENGFTTLATIGLLHPDDLDEAAGTAR